MTWIPRVLEATSEQDLSEALSEVFDDGSADATLKDIFPEYQRSLQEVVRDAGFPASARLTLLRNINLCLLSSVLLHLETHRIRHPLTPAMLKMWEKGIQDIDWGPPDFREKREAWFKKSLQEAKPVNTRWQGVVRNYDSTKARGDVIVGKVSLSFPITCFFSDPPNKPPKAGEQVDVVFQNGAPSKILAIFAKPRHVVWLEGLYALVEKREVELAMKYIFEGMMLDRRRQDLPTWNCILQAVDLDRLEVTTRVGLLMATKGNANFLPERPALMHRVRISLDRTETPERVETLLSGL